ncbi:MAG TPA: hypothetical protein VGV38_06400 [Pyrinomonadaceae bacterium]|nr:hypothetical protein [Pyrinomonadaceae bacterium]
MSREESEALGELRRLLISLGGAGVTRELAASTRRAAEEISRRFDGSAEAAELCGKILRASQPALSSEPEPCRALRERLDGGADVTTRTIIAALGASGFAGRRHVPPPEEECFRDIIHASLQTLHARLESTEGVPHERLRSRVSSLRELLDVLPPDILAPRQLVESLIRQLEISSARDSFDELLRKLRGQVAEQDTDAAEAAREKVRSNAWVLAHPAAPEVKEAQQHFARLEELRRARSTMLADAGRVRLLLEGERKDYDQALGELQLAEARLRQTGLLKRKELDEAIALLVEGLAREYESEERAAADPAPTEAALEAGLSKLQRLSTWLQKVPAVGGPAADGLRQKCATLMKERALLLNDVCVSDARGTLKTTPVEAVPVYIEQLGASELLALGAWAEAVRRVWDSLQHLKDAGGAPFEQAHLDRLERAEEVLGPCPLALSALGAARAYRLRAAREYLRESSAQVKEVEDACMNLSNAAPPPALSDAITAAVQSILRYRRTQEAAPAAFAETQLQFPAECVLLDQRVRLARESRLPEAVNRWAAQAAASSRTEAEVDAMRRSLTAWREVLGTDFPHDEIARRFHERSAELRIQTLEAEGMFDEALRLLEAKPALLSDEFRLGQEERLLRRRAARNYAPGGEEEVVNVVKRYGPDSDLLRILIDDFRESRDCRCLARLHGSLPEIESVDRKAALLVRWSYDFQSDALEALAATLAESDEPESVTLFAKAVAAGDRHVAALRVLGDTLKRAGHWQPFNRRLVEASHKVASDRFAAASREIGVGLSALERRCDPERLARRPSPVEDDAELLRQLDVAFAGARNFLAEAVNQVADWLDFLSTARRFGVACDPALLGAAQELDHRLAANRQLLIQLWAAWRAVFEKGWEKIPDMENTLNVGAFTTKIAPVAAVTQLLHEYLKNYRPTVQSVDRLVESWRQGGDGLTRAELTRLVERFADGAELKYDFRRGQDRFRLAARFGGKSFAEFVGELKAMTAEVEAVASYEEQLNGMLVGEKEPLRLRLEQGSETSRREIVKLLRRFDARGVSLLELYRNPPRVSKSPVASARLRALQAKPWFDLLRRAAALDEDPKDEGVARDRA